MTPTILSRLLAALTTAGLVAGITGCGTPDQPQTGPTTVTTTSQPKDTNMPEATLKDLVVTRVFDAPVEQVWSAWTESDHVRKWWGPSGFTSPIARMDVREGGTSLVAMRSPEGHDMYNTWRYLDVVPLRRLEFILNFADGNGDTIDPAALGLPPGIPRDVRHVITFRALDGGGTEMTVNEYGYANDEVVQFSKAGLESSLDKMAASFTGS
jgi:uncharacterized protein YndB with AHSA1/START domain